jgi:nitrogen-specific signal transduction histidine kinase/CheY-like chemotaxis protein
MLCNRTNPHLFMTLCQALPPGQPSSWPSPTTSAWETDETMNLEHLEARMRQAQKMEVLGQLMGGIIHEFNNYLTIILGHSDLAMNRLAEDHTLSEGLKHIRQAAEQATDLTQQLLAFCRARPLPLQSLNLNTVVTRSQRLFRPLLGKSINLSLKLEPSLGQVRADASLLGQVLINLLLNARDAMPDGGEVSVATANLDCDVTHARKLGLSQPGRYVLLSVSDTGHGIDEETRARLFEPFFTTKDIGKGTGLGLSMARWILEQFGGHITFDSQPRCGATFKILLPRTDRATSGRLLDNEELPRGTETVLLVENQEEARTRVSRELRSLGYSVLTAAHGLEALQVFQQHDDPIHLLVANVAIPGLDGPGLTAFLRHSHPDLKVLLLSEDPEQVAELLVGHAEEEATPAVLAGPLTSSGILACKIREVLDQEHLI